VNDLEKAIEKARLQQLAQSSPSDTSRDIKSRSVNVPSVSTPDIKSSATSTTKIGTRDLQSLSNNMPEIRSVDIQPEDVDESDETAQKKIAQKNNSRNRIKRKRARNLRKNANYESINGDSNANYNATNGKGYSNYSAINGDSNTKHNATNGKSYSSYNSINGESNTNCNATNGISYSNYDSTNGDSVLNFNAANGNSYFNYDATNGDSSTNYNATNGDGNTNYNATNGSSYSNIDALNGDSDSSYNAIEGDSNVKRENKIISPHFANKNRGVCVLPFEKMQNAGFITPTVEKGKLTEEYRRIKRPLLKNLRNDEITNGLKNVIAVTSSISGEGKTYSAVNLAMSMALEKERTVLLVDADVVKGSTGRLFSISPDQPGLTDVLSDDSIDVADVIMRTNVKNLRFMSGGMMQANTNELLASDLMRDLIVELARRYDDRIIILDCPPILQTSEADILIDHAGQVVFVVAEEETRQKMVVSAIDQIDADKYVGVLVNKSSSRLGNYDYYRPYTTK